MLRIDPTTDRRRSRTRVPADNPFVGDGRRRARRSGRAGCATRGGSRSTATTGDLWIADVGQNDDRGDRRRPGDRRASTPGKGLNFGWSAFEGDEPLQRRRRRPTAHIAAVLRRTPTTTALLDQRRRARPRRRGRRPRRLVRLRRLLRRRRSGRSRSSATATALTAGRRSTLGDVAQPDGRRRRPGRRACTSLSHRPVFRLDPAILPRDRAPRRTRSRRRVARSVDRAGASTSTSTSTPRPGPRRRDRRGGRRRGPARPGRRAGPRAPRRSSSTTTASNTSPSRPASSTASARSMTARVDAVGQRLAARPSPSGSSANAALTSSGTGRPLATASAPRRRSGRRAGAAARWRGRTSPPSPRATASRRRRTARSDAPPPARRTASRNAAARRVVGRQRALELGQRRARPASQAEGPGRVAQPADGPLVGLGHHPEQAGAGGVQRVGDGEVGGQRHRRRCRPRWPAGVEAQRPARRRRRLELLLGELDPWRAAALLGGVDAPGQLGEAGRQVVRRARCRRPAWPGCGSTARSTPSSATVAVGVDAHVNTTAGRGPSGSRLAAPSDSAGGYSGACSSGR